MRPIDVDALLQRWNNLLPSMARDEDGAVPVDFRLVVHDVSATPTLTLDDLRPKGRWDIVEFDKDSRRITIECSECGMVEEMTVMAYGFGHNFCHICGADMREEGAFCDTGRN